MVPATPVYLYQMLRSQGDAVARMAVGSGARDFRIAVAECLECAAKPACAAWLESGRCDGYEKFCGNAEYVARMRALAKAY